MTGLASGPGGAAVSTTLEAELDWSAIKAGRCFPQVAFALHDASVDAYLQATGEIDLYYEPAAGFVPPLYTTLVRFVKASLGGRWPSGTIQLGYRITMRRALRRGELLTLDARIARVEDRGERHIFEIVSCVRDSGGAIVIEYSSASLWAGAVPSRPPAANYGTADALSRSIRPGHAAPPAADAFKLPPDAAPRLGPLIARFDLTALQAFGAMAGALDPIHVDPEFARTTRYGTNIVQGRLVATLPARLLLAHFGMAWLERGELQVRFLRPVLVGEEIVAWGALPCDGGDHLRVWCEDPRGERTIEGFARLGAPATPPTLCTSK